MKKSLLAGSTVVCIALVGSANASLIITGLFDGPQTGGEPKVVELFATTDVADLSVYAVGSANNGGGTDGPENFLSGSVSAGGFLYIVDDNSFGALGEGFNAYFGFTPSLIYADAGAASINGDDAVELFYDPTGAFAGDESVIDVFGDINQDGTGTDWDHLDGWAYRTSGTGPDGSTFEIGNWMFSGVDANDGETSNATAANPMPVGTYFIPEPSTLILAVLGLAGLASRRRR